MEEQNRVNEEKDRNTQRQELVTEREKISMGPIRKVKTLAENATKLKPVEEKYTQKREGQRKMIKERNIKTENTISVLKEEDTKPLLEEEELHTIEKIDEIKRGKEKRENKKNQKPKEGRKRNETQTRTTKKQSQ